MALWESRNNGETWKKTKQLTRRSKHNHTYARAPVNAPPRFLRPLGGRPRQATIRIEFVFLRQGRSCVFTAQTDVRTVRETDDR